LGAQIVIAVNQARGRRTVHCMTQIGQAEPVELIIAAAI
jgi:hypothetical protein